MLEKIKNIIIKILPNTDASHINENSRFSEDLCFDSIHMVMLSVELEDAFGFKFSHPIVFETVSDVCGYLDCRV